MSQDTNQDLDFQLLDMELSDIETLPGFETPHPGEYLLRLKSALKKVKNNIVVETGFEVLECTQKDNAEDPDAVPGTKFSNIYTIQSGNTDAEKKAEAERMGKGKLKELLANIAESTGQGNVGVLVRDYIADCTVKATVKRRQDKEDKDVFYPVIKNMTLA